MSFGYGISNRCLRPRYNARYRWFLMDVSDAENRDEPAPFTPTLSRSRLALEYDLRRPDNQLLSTRNILPAKTGLSFQIWY